MTRIKTTEKYPVMSLDYQIKQDKIWLNPEYQRESVWTLPQKRLLIDSLLRDIDIPKLYFRGISAPPRELEVVDGQQRLRAIVEFLDGGFTLPKNAPPIGKHEVKNRDFKALPMDLQMKLQNAQLDIVVLHSGYSEDDVEEIFLRLQNGSPLNAAEKRRALPGGMRTVVLSLAKHKFFKNLAGFSAKRFAYEDAVAKTLHLLLKGAITDIRETSIRATYAAHKELSEADPQVVALKKAMNFLVKAFADKQNPELKKFATLSLLFLTVELLESYDIQKYSAQFADAYLDFEARRAEDGELEDEKQEPRFQAYFNSSRADSIADLEYRHRTLLEELMTALPDLQRLDGKRQFRPEQRLALFYRAKGICQLCLTQCKDTDWHADHKKPHSKGGQTVLSNGQVLCPACNLKKGNRQDD